MGSKGHKKSKLNYDTRLQRRKNFIFSTIDNEVVLLNIDEGNYFNLNEIGAYVWGLLEHPCTFEYILSQLKEEFDVTKETCKDDTEPFLNELLKNNIIHIVDD